MRTGGEYDHSGNIRLLIDCAQVCETTAELQREHGTLPERNYDLCAEMCERAARVCAMFPHDRMMLLGQDACRRGAAYCRQKAGMLV
jgi:hypothetical protein